MTWILLFWVVSNDSGFPDPSPGYMEKPYVSLPDCLEGGKALKVSKFSHVSAWYCAVGDVPGVKAIKGDGSKANPGADGGR
jgi:hypothetical protein